jgi:ElaA protein
VPPLVLYGALALRSRVFVVEQHCVYQDLDGVDPDALLVIGILPAGAADAPAEIDPAAHAGVPPDAEVIATARVLAPGRRFAEPSIGRVCTSPSHRHQGLGRKLMEFSIRSARQHHPGWPIRISAQAYLQPFYESLGFDVQSAPYLEDAIPHIEMRLARA